ncbi:hypothetical protein POTOM_005707 [Populus tomentosa]|uniref:U6 snRNA-associated Sm-like protein LSm8 n=1 Tax=Populus tomentosa TaxID=118781 RepID=A0A8X8AJT3_POPTO|nr:hypothetical protein POTOM_005707 [Populus tomentosa]
MGFCYREIKFSQPVLRGSQQFLDLKNVYWNRTRVSRRSCSDLMFSIRIDLRLFLSLEAYAKSHDKSLSQLVSRETISIITNDGRNIVGVLKGFDQATNIILDESHERVYSTKEGVQQLVLGLYIIRGDNIGVVGELDEELDAHLDLSSLRAHPLKPVIH